MLKTLISKEFVEHLYQASQLGHHLDMELCSFEILLVEYIGTGRRLLGMEEDSLSSRPRGVTGRAASIVKVRSIVRNSEIQLVDWLVC